MKPSLPHWIARVSLKQEPCWSGFALSRHGRLLYATFQSRFGYDRQQSGRWHPYTGKLTKHRSSGCCCHVNLMPHHHLLATNGWRCCLAHQLWQARKGMRRFIATGY